MPGIVDLDLLGLDSLLSEEERETRATVRRLVDERVRPYIGQWYEDGTMPARELAVEFGQLGLLGMHLSGYGCAGASAVAYGLACQELEAGDSGVRSLVGAQGSQAMYAIWRYGSAEQKRTWLPHMATGEAIGCFALTEPEHGSDPAAMTTQAIRQPGGDWVLRGTKTWITNAPVADVAVIWARTPAGDSGGAGQPEHTATKDIAGFLVPIDTPGIAAREIRHKMSLRASPTGEIVLDDVRLPADAALPDGYGLQAPLGCLTEARYGIAWGALGAARDCLSTALEYATNRTQFGRPIAGFQLTQAKLADAAAELAKGELLALHLGRTYDAGRLTPAMVTVGKLNNVREAIAIARQCRTILGANGISGEYPVTRHADNLQSVLVYEGAAEIHQLVLGQHLTGISAFG